MSEPSLGGADKEQLTVAGCVLTVFSLAVLFASAVPIVLWRDSAGRPLPRYVALVSPLLIGAAFHGIGTAILWLLGLKVLTKPGTEKPDWPEL
jgi:hypothetical protein